MIYEFLAELRLEYVRGVEMSRDKCNRRYSFEYRFLISQRELKDCPQQQLNFRIRVL